MENTLYTRTNETFTTKSGKQVRYQDILVGIDNEVRRYGFKGGRGLVKEDIDDLRQDAFKKAVISKGSYDPEKCHDCPEAYGYSIAVRCEHDAFRKAARRASTFTPYEVQDEDGESHIPILFSGYRGDEFEADRDLETEEAMSYINGKIASLGKNQREVLELSIQGIKPQKIAKILGCTPNAVSSRLCRAKQALAEALGAKFLSEYGYKLSA